MTQVKYDRLYGTKPRVSHFVNGQYGKLVQVSVNIHERWRLTPCWASSWPQILLSARRPSITDSWAVSWDNSRALSFLSNSSCRLTRRSCSTSASMECSRLWRRDRRTVIMINGHLSQLTDGKAAGSIQNSWCLKDVSFRLRLKDFWEGWCLESVLFIISYILMWYFLYLIRHFFLIC